MSDERPCKRPRLEHPRLKAVSLGCRPARTLLTVDPPAKPDVPKRDKKVWLTTGNIILVADGRVAYRVYRGLLANKSEVFRDMFELPPPPESEATKIDGCPVVHLSDSPADLKPLLLVLFCRKNYFFHRDEPIPVPFSTLDSLIRMTHKYGVQDLYNTALARLQKYYTTTLRSWIGIKTRQEYLSAQPSDAVALLRLARLTETPSLLPTAYLMCCSLDATTRTKKPSGAQTPLLADLDPWDYARVLTGKAKLTQLRASRVFNLLTAVPCAKCATPEKCREAALGTLRRVGREELQAGVHDQYVLDAASPWFWRGMSTERPCIRCTTASDEEDDTMRAETWRQLPEIFDIEVKDWASEPGLADKDAEEYAGEADEGEEEEEEEE